MQQQSFEQELELLRERLQEAEEMHRAISHGEVDAFVVGPGGDGRVLLLANAYQRYRQLVERMQQGAVTATPDGQVLFSNQRFAGDGAARDTLRDISEEINGLARMIDQMLDVEAMGGRRK